MINISLPIRTVSEANSREHWAKKAKRAAQQRAIVFASLRNMRAEEIPPPIVVKLTRVGRRFLDDDNLARSFKAVRDGIADAIGVDDGDSRIRWHYAQRKGDYSIDVVIA
jgi:crossover junction endodeoxyribonuclease RusA